MMVYLLFGFVVVLALVAISLFIRAGQREREEEVLLRLRASGSGDDAQALSLQAAPSQISNPILRVACHLIWRSGTELNPGTVARILWVLVALVPAVIFVFGWFIGLSAIAVFLAVGWGYLTSRAARRRAKIVEQMPSFLESSVRVLSAGNTLDEAFAASARESQDPIRPLFLSIGRQVRLGAPVEAVLMEMSEVHQLRELKVMALAASINRKYGGSLRNVLRSLIHAIRARDTAARELRALTAETRFSAMVLSVIPIILMVVIFLQNPGYYTGMWAQFGGRMLLIGSVALQVVGVLVIYRMMRSTEGPA